MPATVECSVLTTRQLGKSQVSGFNSNESDSVLSTQWGCPQRSTFIKSGVSNPVIHTLIKKKEKMKPERLSSLPKVTQLENRARFSVEAHIPKPKCCGYLFLLL